MSLILTPKRTAGTKRAKSPILMLPSVLGLPKVLSPFVGDPLLLVGLPELLSGDEKGLPTSSALDKPAELEGGSRWLLWRIVGSPRSVEVEAKKGRSDGETCESERTDSREVCLTGPVPG